MAYKEYIEREAVRFAYEKSLADDNHRIEGASAIHRQEHHHIMRILEKMSAADVVEVRHGYWKWETKIEPQAQNRLYCSICDNECLSKGNYYVKSKYCPHCGAKMDGERKEQT